MYTRSAWNRVVFVCLASALVLHTADADVDTTFKTLSEWVQQSATDMLAANNVEADLPLHLSNLKVDKGTYDDVVRSATQSVHRTGLAAAKDFKQGDLISSVPLHAGFTIESLLVTTSSKQLLPFVNHVIGKGLTTDSRAFLALFLLYEKHGGAGTPSPHKPFLDSLPDQVDSVCFFNQKELAALQCPQPEGLAEGRLSEQHCPLLQSRREILQAIDDSFTKISEALKEKEFADLFAGGLTRERWSWAYGTVLNRGVTIAMDNASNLTANAAGTKMTLALLPLVDYMNFANPDDATVRLVPRQISAIAKSKEMKTTADSGDVVMSQALVSQLGFDDSFVIDLVAARDLSQGEELTFAYVGGPMTNTQLLVHYGFAVHRNQYEGVALDLGLSAQDPDYAIKHYIIQHNNLVTSTVVRLNASIDPYFFQALRAKELTSEDLRHLNLFQYDFDPKHKYFSLQNELKSNIQLLSSIEALLKFYPTTLAEDVAIMGAADFKTLSPNEQNAIRYRVAVKRVLHVIILKCYKNLTTVFEELTQRWAADSDRAQHTPTETGGEGGGPVPPEEKAKALAEYKTSLTKWSTEVKEWSAEWEKWLALASGTRQS